MSFRFTVLALAASFALATAAQAQPKPPPHNPAIRKACDADIKAVCSDAKPGQPTMQCVMKNRDKMSDGCKKAMAAMAAQGQGQGMGQGQGQGMSGGMGSGGMPPKPN